METRAKEERLQKISSFLRLLENIKVDEIDRKFVDEFLKLNLYPEVQNKRLAGVVEQLEGIIEINNELKSLDDKEVSLKNDSWVGLREERTLLFGSIKAELESYIKKIH